MPAMTFQALILIPGLGTLLLDYLPFRDRRKIAASWTKCFAFLPETPDVQQWVDHHARRYAAEQVATASIQALHLDATLAEKAAGQLYVNVGRAVADIWNATHDPVHSACSSGRHKTIVSLLRVIDCFNKQDYALALRALALCGPCPATAFPRVIRLVARVWANIGRLRVIPQSGLLRECVWSIECSCSDISVVRMWNRQVMQYLDGDWDDWVLGTDGFDVIFEPNLFVTVYATHLSNYVDQQVLCISDVIEMFVSD